MPRPRFKKIYVEITSVCNLACTFCPKTERSPGFLTTDQFRRIVAQVAPVTRHLYVHVKGEPLLHPGLDEMLDVADAAGLKVNLVTNGTLIGKVADRIVGHPALHSLHFSLHSYSGTTQAALQAYLGPVFAFTRSTDRGQTIVALRFWRESPPELLRAVEREFGWVAPADRDGRGFAVANRTFVHFEQAFTWPSPQAPVVGTSGFCLGLRDQVAVLVDGTVVPCCLDGEGVIALGNLFTDDLTTILGSPRARELYEGFTGRRCVEDLCQRCRFRQRFDTP